MKADDMSLIQLLQYNMEIPFFQRSYVWDDENCKTLLEDIEQSIIKNQPLFLGCVVLKEIPRQAIKNTNTWQLIDGQQRITTLSILLKVISLYNKDCEPEFNKFFTDSKYTVKHNHYDVKAFDEVMHKNNTKPYETNDSKIFDTFNLYVELLKNKNSTELRDLYDYAVNAILFIFIEVAPDEDEQKIFDSLNSLGVRLTTAELLKNYLFNSQNPEDVKLFEVGWIDDDGIAHDGWKNCFERDPETKKYWDEEITHGRIKRSNIDLLLHSYLSIQSITSKGVYSKLDDLFDSYKKFLSGKDTDFKHDVIKQICSLSQIYKNNINYEFKHVIPKTNIERLNLLLFAGELTTVIPYFVYLLSDYNNNNKACDDVCKCLTGYLLRRLATGITQKNYNNFFASMIRDKVNSVRAFMDKVNDKAETNGIPSDEYVCTKICTTEFSANEKPKVILYLLESFLNNDKSTLPLGDYDRYELEHIMPKQWKEHWYTVNKDQPIDVVQQHINNIGNMTLLTEALNKAIKNESWEVKVNGKTINNKRYDGYKKYVQGVYIFDEKYLQKPNWTISVIDDRAKEIGEMIIKQWPL